VTATSPIADLDLVLEPVEYLYFNSSSPCAPASRGRLEPGCLQHPGDAASTSGCPELECYSYDVSEATPTVVGGVFKFPGLFFSRSVTVTANEFSGEQRSAGRVREA